VQAWRQSLPLSFLFSWTLTALLSFTQEIIKNSRWGVACGDYLLYHRLHRKVMGLALPLILDTVLIHTLECFNISCTYTINLSVSFPHSSVVYNIPCNFQRVSGFKRVASFNSKWMSWVACWNLMKKVLLQVLHGPNLLVFVQIMTSRQQCPTFLILSGSFLAPPHPHFSL
jgi:hypothetical protein